MKDKIIENVNDYIPIILENIGCTRIKSYQNEFRAARGNGNPTGVCVKKDTLISHYRSDQEIKGDIITLVQQFKSLDFFKATKYICKVLEIESSIEKEAIYRPFGGYYKGFEKFNSHEINLTVYPKEILNEYLNIGCTRFQKDGVSLDVQSLFDIRYDTNTDRIIVPWHNEEGIIGIMTRYNGDDYEEKGISKWYPAIPFPKSQTLYGFYHNYSKIQEKGIVFVGESEKFTMQLKSMNIHTGTSLGCHSLSKNQINLIKSCYPEKVVLCYDEGVSEEDMRNQLEIFKGSNHLLNIQLGYIYDKNNEILKKGSKNSPTDLGKDAFLELYKNHTYLI